MHICNHPEICSGYGDPHYASFDGAKFTFNGNCSYVLVHSTDKDIPLTIEAINGPCSSLITAADGSYCINQLRVYYGSDNVRLSTFNLV